MLGVNGYVHQGRAVSADETEVASIWCTVLVLGWVFTLLGGIALGFWVLK